MKRTSPVRAFKHFCIGILAAYAVMFCDSASAQQLIFFDNFNILGSSHDINYQYNLGRQSGLLGPLLYSELAGTKAGGTNDAWSQLGNPNAPGSLFLSPGNLTYIWFSPNHNFKEARNFTIELDIDPLLDSSPERQVDSWVGVVFGASRQATFLIPGSPPMGAGGIGINLRQYAYDFTAMEIFSDDQRVHVINSLPTHPGPYHLRIDVDVAAYDGSSVDFQVTLDHVYSWAFTRPQGFTDNFITLSGYAGADVVDGVHHSIDNFSLTGTFVPVPPTCQSDVYHVDEDSELTVAAQDGTLANDSSFGPITAALVSPPSSGTLVFNADGSFNYLPTANFNGVDQFTYEATNTVGTTGPVTVNLTVNSVNDLPTADDKSVIVDEDSSMGITLSGTDDDGSELTYVRGTPSHGTLTGTGASLTYTPFPNYNGPDSFTYVTNDLTADSAPATVSITVSSVSDLPVANSDTSETRDNLAVSIPVLANDTDGDGDTLTIASVTSPSKGTATVSGGSVTYTPNPYSGGPDTFSYTVRDATGNTSTTTVTVNVYAVTVTGRLSISQGKITLNKKTGRYEQKVSVTNLTGAPIGGPMCFVMENFTLGVVPYISNGSTIKMSPAGSPYVNLFIGQDNILSPNESSRATLIEFYPAGVANFTYTFRVLAGEGSR